MGLGRDYINDHMYELTREKGETMGAPQQKPQNVGTAYINVKRGSPQELVDEIKGAVEFLASKKAYLSISMRKSTGDGYVPMTGFFNGFKKTEKDPDIVIRLSTISYKNEKPAAEKSYGNKGGYKKSFAKKEAPAKAEQSYGNKGGYKKSFAKKEAPAKVEQDQDGFGGEEVPFL